MHHHRRSIRKRTFLKSFYITVAVCSIIVIALAITWSQLVTPPSQREIIAAQHFDHLHPVVDAEGFLIVHDDDIYEEEDECPWPVYNAPAWATDRRPYFWTFLIIGLNEGTNANTVMVASYCGVAREANLVSIPRDVPVNPTRNGRKLASSYIIGRRHGGVDGGVAQVQRDVQTVIGFVPDFYVLIDYDSFFTIIDAVGGIEVYVPQRMRYNDPFQNLFIDLHPGLQHMDSEAALHFVRFRQANRGSGYPGLPDGDLGRVRNQQAVIEAVISRLLRPENLNPIRINEFVNIFNESVRTNISFTEMLFFATQLNQIRRTDTITDALSTYTFEGHTATVNGESYVFLSPQAVVELLNRTINPFDMALSAEDLRIVRQ